MMDLLEEAVRNFLIKKKMEPMAGIEPATDGLRNRCSTAELHWLKTIENKAFFMLLFSLAF
jgi:hypothetical protein